MSRNYFWWVFTGVMVLILLLFMYKCGNAATPISVSVPPGMSCYHVVEKGDTLSDIAELYFRDYREWRYLAEINHLVVEERDGISYVWLEIGQRLLIWTNPAWTQEQVDEYKAATADIAAKAMFIMIRRPVPNIQEAKVIVEQWLSRSDHSMGEEETRQWLGDNRSLSLYINEMKRLKQALNDLHRYNIADEVYNMTSILDNPFITKDCCSTKAEIAVAHRRFVLYMMALIDQESDGFSVRGKHGECGILQIKPHTAILVHEFPSDAEEEVDHELMNNTLFSIITAIKIINKAGTSDPHDIAQYYNKGSDRAEYADKLVRRFEKLLIMWGGFR